MNRRLDLVGRLALAVALFSIAAANGDEAAKPGLQVGDLHVDKILFLGNSITLHGPAPKIGWEGDWGMAASTRDKDYVHLLLSRVATAAGGKPAAKVKNIAEFERQLAGFNIKEQLKDELAFEADVVILAIGENVASLETDEAKEQFRLAFANLLSELKQHGKPVLFVRSNFWANPAKDEILLKVCEEAGGVFVDNRQLGGDKANFARSERKIAHDGVAAHPGDKGMKEIADSLWKAIEQRAAKAAK